MEFLRHNLLTILIFLPAVGAIATLFLNTRDQIKWTATGFTLATFVISLLLFATYHWSASGPYAYTQFNPDGTPIPGSGVVQMVQEGNWIPAFNVKYKIGIDGLSFPLVLLSTF